MGGGVVNASPRPIYTLEWPDTTCVGGWVDPSAVLEGQRNSRLHRDSIPGQTNPSRVAIPTELSRPTQRKRIKRKRQEGTKKDESGIYTSGISQIKLFST